jgi:hypothetical protein
LREDGAHLAASSIYNNFFLSTGRVENALALHLFAISSFIGWSVFAGFVIIVVSNEDVDDAFSFSWLLLTIIHKQYLLIISMYCFNT